MSWQDTAKTLIAKHEGVRLAPYKDSLGIPTIGAGFNMTRPDARARLAAVGLTSWAPPIRLTMEQVFKLLDLDVADCVTDLRSCVVGFDGLSDSRKVALCDMRYNIGPVRFRAFRKTLDAVQEGNFAQAADEMLASVWAEQVGSRAHEDSELMRNG